MATSETSDRGPALVVSPPGTPIGWTFTGWKGSGNDVLNLRYNDTAGVVFKAMLHEHSHHAPALTYIPGGSTGFAAYSWTGPDGYLRVAYAVPGGDMSDTAPFALYPARPLPAVSDRGPAIACPHAGIFVAWRGTGDGRLNIAHVEDRGPSGDYAGLVMGGAIATHDQTAHAPVLAAAGENLYVAWTGTDRRINIARVDYKPGAPTQFGGLVDKVTLNDTSDAAPALAWCVDRLVLAWRGAGNTILNIGATQPGGLALAGATMLREQSHNAPALAVAGDAPVLGWTGTDQRLNVASVDIWTGVLEHLL